MISRLIWIEARRNVARWLVPVILLVAWWMLSARGWIPILWGSTNDLVQESVIPFATPALAGAAAWMAGREQRRGTQDLLATIPASSILRALATWSATAIWGLVACALVATFMMGRTGLLATWGGPDLQPLLGMLASILAFSAWGYVIGTLVPSRFTAPTVAIGAFGIVLYLSNYMSEVGNGAQQTTWITYLAPDKMRVDSAYWHALLYFGLAGVAVSLLALSYRRGIPATIALVGSLVLMVAGAGMIRHEWIHNHNVVIFSPGIFPPAIESAEEQELPILVCEGNPVTVCVHPMYEPLLNEAVDQANRLAEPLLSLPGVPLRAGPNDVHFTGGGTRSIFYLGPNASLNVSSFANSLVANDALMQYGEITNQAQLALRSWLLQRTGIASHWRCDDSHTQSWRRSGMPTQRACEAASRFSTLSEAEQRNWLEAHYTDLRAGNLTLEDLPPAP